MKRSWSVLAFASALLAVGCLDKLGFIGGVDVQESPPDEKSPFSPPENFDAGPRPKGPQPAFGPTVSQADAPPALSGGTLLVTRDGTRVVAADPDRDRLYVVTLADKSVVAINLSKHDEPGRLVEDDQGNVHVALRRGGAVVTVDPVTGTVLSRRDVCPEPRGIAFDAKGGRLLVACAGGELVQAAPAAGGATSVLARISRDLRDVVVSGGRIFVSRFRSAEVLEVDAAGALLTTTRPDVTGITIGGQGEATLAWRMIPPLAGDPNQQPIVVHQAATTGTVAPSPGGYGAPSEEPNDCSGSGGIVFTALSRPESSPGGDATGLGPFARLLPQHLVLPLDITTDGARFAIVAAGNAHTPDLPQVFLVPADPSVSCGVFSNLQVQGQATAIGFLRGGGIVVQSREPAQLEVFDVATVGAASRIGIGLGGMKAGGPTGTTVIALANESREDTGHAIFHSNSGSGLACASCHGEGGDDGHVWQFDRLGARRTPSLRGTLAGTAPYHWSGEMKDIAQLALDVMSGRMNGPTLDSSQNGALEKWLFAIPAPRSRSGIDTAAADRGRALFTRSDVGCASCHSGAKLTSSATVFVGTGGPFQVPSLVGVAARAPFLHDGCAQTLKERFSNPSCGGGSAHGNTTTLAPTEIDDLIAYLETL